MRKSINYILFIYYSSFFSCNYLYKDDIERFESKISFKEKLIETKINKRDTAKKVIYESIIGYDSQYREINNNNFQFFEYNENGQIIKRYKINNQRIKKLFSKPILYEYHYKNGRLQNVTHKTEFEFLNNQNFEVIESYKYDEIDRLIMKTNFSSDTTTFSYNKNDSLPISQTKIEYITNFDFEVVRRIRTTYFEYDSIGRKIRETWKDNDKLSMTTQFFYDSKNRIIQEKDSSLNNHTSPNSYILFWRSIKYDDNDRIIEEINTGGTIKDPKPSFRYKTIYEYTRI